MLDGDVIPSLLVGLIIGIITTFAWSRWHGEGRRRQAPSLPMPG